LWFGSLVDNFFSKFRSEVILAAVLFIQVIALATQVRVPSQNPRQRGEPSVKAGMATPEQVANQSSTRLIRVWASALIQPFQRLTVATGEGVRGIWRNYIDLHSVRKENDELRRELDSMRIHETRMQQDAEQGRRLQSLLRFKEQFIAQTIAAQVIGTSGTDLARVIYIDRGARDGITPGMAVITPDGIAGKILRADRSSSQVLLINDPSSGAGVLIERLRLNGILKGTAGQYPEVQNVMADEPIQAGDRVITTGGDHVFPKGLPVGTVESVAPDHERDPFMAIKVKPAVNLAKLEEVLVVTQLAEREPAPADSSSVPIRAADMLAARLPSVPKKDSAKDKEPVETNGEATPPDTNVETNPATKPAASAQAAAGKQSVAPPKIAAAPKNKVAGEKKKVQKKDNNR
jgi:rod shape-determining protein MreC